MHPEPHDPFNLSFMTPEHHRVRNFVVSELPRAGKALPPEYIALKLGLPLDQLAHILDDLEKHLVFLFRNPLGEVAWAYPVTVDETPHRVSFSSGEKIYAA